MTAAINIFFVKITTYRMLIDGLYLCGAVIMEIDR